LKVDSKISIIIPVYNREHLIGETLDSILTQTFTNWECILVDDHSTDATIAVLEAYRLKDKRIKWVSRPNDRFKGANACRNYGFEISRGDFIQWFDSDDIMLPDFLEKKYNALNDTVDFVVSYCHNFNENGVEEKIIKYEGNKVNALNFENFLKEKVYWITQDFLIRKSSLKGVKFNETLQSGQEYNFFMVLLASGKLNGVYINEKLSLRRIHSTSIQQKLKKNLTKALKGRYHTQSTTLLQLAPIISKPLRIYFLNKLIPLIYQLKLRKEHLTQVDEIKSLLLKEKGFFKAQSLQFAIYLAKHFKKGYKFMNYARS
jgi:glycosyltransferase involved in cell wall biosynthesis